MFRVFTCLTGEHDWRLVILAGIVCLLASLVAVSLFHRARASRGRVRRAWLALAGSATGCGIWATHFIAMLAYEPAVTVAYDVGRTMLSLVVAHRGHHDRVRVRREWSRRAGRRRSAGPLSAPALPACTTSACRRCRCPDILIWSIDLVTASIALGVLFASAALPVAVRREDVTGTLISRRPAHARNPVAPLHRDGRGADRGGPAAPIQRLCVVAGERSRSPSPPPRSQCSA